MEGSFFDDLRQLEFFPGAQDEKRAQNCMPVVTSSAQLPTSADHLNQGIYPDEESIDFSAIFDSYNPTASTENTPSVVSSSGTGASTVTATVSTGNPVSVVAARQDTVTSSSNFHPSFQGYLTPDLTLTHTQNMYGSENTYVSSLNGQVEMTPSPPSIGVVDCIGVPPTPSPHVVQIDSSISAGNFTALRPAPGKQRPGKPKKHSVDKHSCEYRQKRDRNNVAVRKSREKSKVRVLDTEKRVKELEEENTQLQSKIALLSKELNVLKSLFTSAGVSQPPSFHAVKDEAGRGRN